MGQALGDVSLSISRGVPSLLRAHCYPDPAHHPMLGLVPTPWHCPIVDATPHTPALGSKR